MKEFAQLEDLDVYEAIDAQSLTTDQQRAALRAINLIKEKRNGDDSRDSESKTRI